MSLFINFTSVLLLCRLLLCSALILTARIPFSSAQKGPLGLYNAKISNVCFLSSSIRGGDTGTDSDGSTSKENADPNEIINTHKSTSENFIPRYQGPPLEEMTEEQREIRDEIVKTRPRTGLSGPFGPWLAVPDIARPAQTLGRVCRYDTSLSFRESELIILLTGAKTKSHAEFDIHVGEAIKAGISMDIISAIPRDDQFSLKAVKNELLPLLRKKEYSPREIAIVTFASELLEMSTISDATYDQTKTTLDGKDSVLVEITSIIGYYTFVAYTLNVFQIPSKR